MRGGTQTRTIDLMVTPRVVEEVQRHFNCSDLEGAELEDQGGDGTALTHWEKRIFQNEAMTGTVHTENPVYSRLTFALLEDSGWYLPNYDLASGNIVLLSAFLVEYPGIFILVWVFSAAWVEKGRLYSVDTDTEPNIEEKVVL